MSADDTNALIAQTLVAVADTIRAAAVRTGKEAQALKDAIDCTSVDTTMRTSSDAFIRLGMSRGLLAASNVILKEAEERLNR